MWSTIDRARRLLLRDAPAVPTAADVPSESLPTTPTPRDFLDDVAVTLGRPEVVRLGTALEGLLALPGTRPDTPAQLEAALSLAIERWAGTGRPAVQRYPAGLYTPETWQIRIGAADTATRTGLGRLLDGGPAAWS
ncbi:MAG: hypothetical protein ACJ761_11670 [Chloroflexota bacterium]